MRPRCFCTMLLGLAAAAVLAQSPDRTDTGRRFGLPRPGAATVSPIEPGRVGPDDFGVSGDSVSTFNQLAFRPWDWTTGFQSDGSGMWPTSLSSVGPTVFSANPQVPEGAVIDYVRLNLCNANGTAPPLVFGVGQDEVDFADVSVVLVNGCALVSSSLLGNAISTNTGHSLYLFVNWHTGPVDGSVKVVSGEVWWHRTVSPAPATASFNDVPVSHPFFQFIEALKAAGITGGCGGGNYCPDNPVTRGQMAVFLSKGLGLYWPN